MRGAAFGEARRDYRRRHQLLCIEERAFAFGHVHYWHCGCIHEALRFLEAFRADGWVAYIVNTRAFSFHKAIHLFPLRIPWAGLSFCRCTLAVMLTVKRMFGLRVGAGTVSSVLVCVQWRLGRVRDDDDMLTLAVGFQRAQHLLWAPAAATCLWGPSVPLLITTGYEVQQLNWTRLLHCAYRVDPNSQT